MRHHIVPRFLLRAWSDGASDGMFQEFRLDVKGLPTTRRMPKATAYQDNLYAFTKPVVAGMSRQAIETDLLRHIDNYAAPVRVKMEKHGLKSLSITERQDWVRFLMSLRAELLLADNPCIFTGDIDAPELIVALPISPTKAFFATRGDLAAAKLRQQSPSTLVVQLNESSVLQARARVYARTDSPKRFIGNRLTSRT